MTAITDNTGSWVSARQVLLRLAEIEDNGIHFYQGLYKGTDSKWVRALAVTLIKAEKRHRERFLKYAQMARDSKNPEDDKLAGPLPKEAVRLLTMEIFVPEDRIKQSARYVRDIEIIKLAINIEENAAILLTELRPLVPKNQQAYITRVIQEEWGHKAKLEEILHKYFS